MATKNDKQILALKKQIEEKKKLLKNSKFNPVTNCSLTMNGVRFNIHTMTKDTLLQHIAFLKSAENGLKEVLPDEKLMIEGFSTTDWIEDLVSKFNTLNISLEKERLKTLETKLHNLLSLDTKVELELSELAKSI
jgi:hypothetical protein